MNTGSHWIRFLECAWLATALDGMSPKRTVMRLFCRTGFAGVNLPSAMYFSTFYASMRPVFAALCGGLLLCRGIVAADQPQVRFNQSPAGMRAVRGDIAFLDASVVEGIEVVEDGDLIAVRQQQINEVAADEASPARNENVHARSALAADAHARTKRGRSIGTGMTKLR